MTPDLEKNLTEPLLLKKLVKLMDGVGAIQKDKENAFHHYKYVSEAAVAAKVQPLLVSLGLVAVPQYRLVSQVGELAIVECTLTLFDSESGAALFPEPKGLGGGMDKGDKSVMKACTAASKYAWLGLLKIPTGDDPEADTRTDEIQRPRALSTSQIDRRVVIGSQPPIPPVERPYAAANWLTKSIQVSNIEKKSENPKAPWLMTVLDEEKPWKLFGDSAAERVRNLMKTGDPFEVKYSVREDKWGRDTVVEEVVHVAPEDPF